jgi:hypothetical protein
VTLTLILSPHPCHCGYVTRGIAVQPMRINKHSMVGTRDGLWALPSRCLECRAPLGDMRTPVMRLDADSAQQVAAYRARRGWPA